jgi:hypothetical protein
MTANADYLYRCPYCLPGQGGLAVNATQVVLYAKERKDAFEVTFQDSPELKLMIRDVGRGAGKPCSHLLYCSATMYVSEVVNDAWTRRGEVYLIRHDPWFATNDLQQAMQEVLCAYEPSEGCPPQTFPAARHHVADPDRVFRVEDLDSHSMWVLNVNSEIISAANPGEFLQELRSWAGC